MLNYVSSWTLYKLEIIRMEACPFLPFQNEQLLQQLAAALWLERQSEEHFSPNQ